MSKFSFNRATWTPVAVADNAVYTDNGYMALQGASSTQVTYIEEVFCGGQATVSSPSILLLARDSTVGVTLTALATPDAAGPLHGSAAAIAAPVVPFVASTTKPKRSNSITESKLNFSYNAYGGIVKWMAGPREEFVMVGNTADLGEASLSAFTGGTPGLTGSHIVYETV